MPLSLEPLQVPFLPPLGPVPVLRAVGFGFAFARISAGFVFGNERESSKILSLYQVHHYVAPYNFGMPDHPYSVLMWSRLRLAML